jgi:hypothetical protein
MAEIFNHSLSLAQRSHGELRFRFTARVVLSSGIVRTCVFQIVRRRGEMTGLRDRPRHKLQGFATLAFSLAAQVSEFAVTCDTEAILQQEGGRSREKKS